MNPRMRRDGVGGDARRDEGAVLPLVLVLMVVSALVVIPLLGYAVSVLKANTVVADTTRDREAAEAGLRVALLDPSELFSECAGGTVDMPSPFRIIRDVDVSTRCQLVEEIGPLNVMGYQTPVGSTATQLGATLPDPLTGTRSMSPAVPPYPADERWWSSTATATTGATWMPDLPTRPATVRTSTPFAMPASFDCTVFLPGSYTAPVTIDTGNVYFASGVYYFENDVTITGDANVVVGYGLEGFDHSECADDIQVSANLVGEPGTFDIDGGGATFVFGSDGHLVVDNTTTVTGVSLRFNQRYADVDHGGRVSIMSVNGDDVADTEHRVDDVVAVPRSTVSVDDLSVPLGGAGAAYTPSSSRFTSKARVPQAPAGLTLTPLTTDDPSPQEGAASITWGEVTGQDAGGALVTEYEVATGDGRDVVCDQTAIVAPAPGTLGCVVTGLRTGRSHDFFVRARNSAGRSTEADAQVHIVSTDPKVAAPEAPTAVSITAYDDAAAVAWTPSVDNGAPVTSYTVTAERVYLVPQTPPLDDDDAPPLDPAPIETHEVLGTCSTAATAIDAAATECTVPDLPDLAAVDVNGNTNVGYRFLVTATNAIGTSVPSIHVPTPAVLAFDGAPAPDPAPAVDRVVEPWIPEAIIDVRVANGSPTVVVIPGYVSMPMGRIEITNPNGHAVKINGGILSSTMLVDDARAGGPESLPIGYKTDIVLQRKIKLVATAGHTTVTAYVQINENGDFKVNSWVVS